MLSLILFFIVLYYQSILINSSFLIGKANHQLYVPSTSSTNQPDTLYYSISCDECLCYAISSITVSYVAINCLTDSHVCYLYRTYNSNGAFQWNTSSILYLFELPPNPTTVALTSTTSTTTTSTTSTTSTTTSTTTAASCIPQATLNGTLYSVRNPTSSNSNYSCYAYTWVATQASATLSFVFRHDPGAWILDDVSVYDDTTQMIINGGFETGNLTGWTYSVSGVCNGNYGGRVTRDPTKAKSGNYYYYDGCNGRSDKLYQTFSTITGNTYNISFWLINEGCCGTTEIATITIS